MNLDPSRVSDPQTRRAVEALSSQVRQLQAQVKALSSVQPQVVQVVQAAPVETVTPVASQPTSRTFIGQIDFGSIPAVEARADVAAPGVVPGMTIQAGISVSDSATNSSADHIVAGFSLGFVCEVLVAGVVTVYARCQMGLAQGVFNICGVYE